MPKYAATESRNAMQFVRDIDEMVSQGYRLDSWRINNITGMIITLFVLDTV